MNARELIEVLGAGDPDAEVWIQIGDYTHFVYRHLETVEDLGPRGRQPRAVVLVPFNPQSAIRNPQSPLPLVRTGQGDFTRDLNEEDVR